MSRTQTITQERPHDHLYDPTYVVSSERDHERATTRSTAVHVEAVPRFDNFFSDVKNFKNYSIRKKVDSRSLAPAHVKPVTVAELHPEVSVDVSGRERHRFFKRPLVAEVGSVVPDTMLRIVPAASQRTAPVPRAPTPPTRTLGTQTDYRDSETQTDPFSPDYVVPDGEYPEILELMDFHYGGRPGERLPVGLRDIENIEKIRGKRDFEAQLPQIEPGETADPKTFMLRQFMLQQIEEAEYAEHEAEIDEHLEYRLNKIRQRLLDRNDEVERHKQERIEKIWKERFEKKEQSLTRVQQRRINALRKLSKQHRDAEGKREHRDVVQEFVSFGSSLYAPRTRDGSFRSALAKADRRNEEAAEVATGMNLESVEELESTLPASVTVPIAEVPRRSRKREEAQMDVHLQKMEETLRRTRLEATGGPSVAKAGAVSLLQRRKPKETPRPPTPERAPGGVDYILFDAVVLLQRLLTGRAVQELMFAGKERRHELIEELRVGDEMEVEEEERAPLDAAAKARLLRDQHLEGAVAAVQAGVIGDTLDFAAKELDRMGEEHRIALLAERVERERRLREAVEAGRRQRELMKRSKREERFRQLALVQRFTEDSYLTQIMRRAVEAVAEEQVQEEAEAAVREEAAAEKEVSVSREVGSLLEGFLLPEVERQTGVAKVDHESRRFVVAAHGTTRKAVAEALETTGLTDE